MSTLAYGALTRLRERAAPGTSASTAAPGLRSWVDVVTALIPVEVLAAQTLVIVAATERRRDVYGNVVITMTSPGAVRLTFAGLVLLSIALYVVGHLGAAGFLHWDRADWLRMLMPPLALLLWSMAARTTAFDALVPEASDDVRSVASIVLAAILVVAVAALAYVAGQSPARRVMRDG